jgi:hypothetical protein
MKNLDKLETILKECHEEDFGRPFVQALRSFQDILTNLAQEKVNLDQLKTQIIMFRGNWKSSGMNLTPKVHIVSSHLYDFVVSKNATNISQFSEQAHESLHAKFHKTWMKYCVKDVANETYSKQLLRALLDFNGNYAI